MTKIHYGWLSSLLLFIALLCCSCSTTKSNTDDSVSAPPGYVPGQTNVLTPTADGTVQTGDEPLILDFSNASMGYFMGKVTSDDTKVNIQVTGEDDVVYNYFLETKDDWTAFPLTAGDGAYLVLAFEDIGNGQYASLFSYPLDVTLENVFLPFLYPNQYVDFSADSKLVSLAASLSADAETDLDALRTLYEYVVTTLTYDNEKAATVKAGYLPDLDETLKTKTGICFDYASLLTAMLRSLSIPTRLAIGYSGDVKHAWIDVYIESVGWVEKVAQFDGNEWKFMDPTFDSAGKDSEAIREYIGDASNYTLQYVY